MTTKDATITEGKCEYINAYRVYVASYDLYRNGTVEFSGDYFVDEDSGSDERIALYTTKEAAIEAAKATMRDIIDDLACSLDGKDIEDVLDNGLYGRGIEELEVRGDGEVWVKVPIVEVCGYSADGEFEVENVGEDGSFDLLVSVLDYETVGECGQLVNALVADKGTLGELDEVIRKAEQVFDHMKDEFFRITE